MLWIRHVDTAEPSGPGSSESEGASKEPDSKCEGVEILWPVYFSHILKNICTIVIVILKLVSKNCYFSKYKKKDAKCLENIALFGTFFLHDKIHVNILMKYRTRNGANVLLDGVALMALDTLSKARHNHTSEFSDSGQIPSLSSGQGLSRHTLPACPKVRNSLSLQGPLLSCRFLMDSARKTR